MNSTTSLRMKRLAVSGLLLAVALLLPFLTGQIPEIGKALSPMHIPVLLCGFVCGWPWGFAVGLIAPLLRSAMFGMPMLYPDAFAMTFELAVYGLAAGLLYQRLPKRIPYIYVSLIAAMLCGRLVWGVVRSAMALTGTTFSLSAFWAVGFANAVPGIICHLILVPLVVIALRRARLMLNG